jgi:hypothetical protein
VTGAPEGRGGPDPSFWLPPVTFDFDKDGCAEGSEKQLPILALAASSRFSGETSSTLVENRRRYM